MSALSLPDDDELACGCVLDGRYRIDGVIGGGGMARVYRAEHLALSRPVAIKVLHADLSRSREAVARFRREATTSGRLVHPNIVTVTDAGMLKDGRCFLVMEALEGETLADRLERDELVPWREAVIILGELLLGLRHAHHHGVVHRDIKPENIFLLRGNTTPIVKILDFGIAKLYASVPGDSRITVDGLTIGTPMYMSPEQAVDGDITPASDLYSSTVVLFEMLTGEPPFLRDDPIAMMKAHLHAPPPRLDEVAPELELPEGLEEIVRRGLAKLSIDRMPSADAYLDMLGRLEAAEPAPPPRRDPTLPPRRAREDEVRDTLLDSTIRPPARPLARRLVAVASLIVAVVAIVTLYVALRSPRDEIASTSPAPAVAESAPAPDRPSPEPPPPAAEPPPPPARAEQEVEARRSASPPGPAARPSRAARTPAPAAEEDRAQVKRWLAEASRALAGRRFDDAGALFQRVLAADGSAGAAHDGLAEVAYNKGDFQRAAQAGRRAVALAPRVAAYRMTLAKAYYKLLRYGDAIAEWQKALEIDPSSKHAKDNIELARSKMR